MKKLKILLDMDETVVDLIGDWLAAYNRQWSDNLTKDKVTGWDFHTYCKAECGKQVYDILQRPGFFDYLPPMPGAVGAVRTLHAQGHELLFATSTPSADAARGKVEWIKRTFGDLGYGISKIIQIADKSLIDADMLVDDKPETILQWAKAGRQIVAIVHPHNVIEATEHASYAAHSWQNPVAAWRDIVSHIRKVADR